MDLKKKSKNFIKNILLLVMKLLKIELIDENNKNLRWYYIIEALCIIISFFMYS
jgi:hypothetical protein